jgi:small subunit ribosomal protein S6e
MRPDVHGGVKARVVLSGGVGFKPRNKGERKGVVVRGNTVTTETTFLNFKIVEKPKGQKKKKAEPKPEEPAEEAQESQE